MIVVMNVLFWLSILVLAGFLAAVAVIAWVAFAAYGQFKRAKRMAEPPTMAAKELARAASGIAQRDMGHVRAIAATGHSAWQTATAAKATLFDAAHAMNFDDTVEAASDAKSAAASLFSSLSQGIGLAQSLLNLVSQLRRQDSAP